MEPGRTLELVRCICMAMETFPGRVEMSDSEEAPALNKGEITYGANCSVRKWDGGSTQSVSLTFHSDGFYWCWHL